MTFDRRSKLATTFGPYRALVPEQGGDPATPAEVYQGKVLCRIPKWQGWAKAAKKKIEEGLGLTLPTGA